MLFIEFISIPDPSTIRPIEPTREIERKPCNCEVYYANNKDQHYPSLNCVEIIEMRS